MLHVNVREVLEQKAKGRHVPDFVVRYLERIVHQDEMNEFLRTYGEETDYNFLRDYIHVGLQCDAEIKGIENLPATSDPVLFVSNHPLGGLDGMIIALMLHDHGRDAKVIVNDILMYLTPIANLFVPVNKVGSQSRQYAERMRQMWESGTDVLSFPAGACSRKQKGGIRDLEWKKSFIRNAVQYRRNIVPLRFEGENSRFFYNLAWWRKLLGIKLNIEMLYLADEMYKAKGKHFIVHVGKPIPYTTFDNSRTPQEWAEYVKQITYSL